MQSNLSGQTLGKYELRDLLGVGGMGAVYRAYDHTLKREVAVKVVNLGTSSPELQVRFIREAQTAARLEHSHIVRVYDYGVERDINYVVMQYLTGGSLSERIRQATELGLPRASLPEVALLLEHLASALDYAHAQGVIHRDIKPQNIMFNNQGQAFIVDFGIAKVLTRITHLTGTSTAVGTPSYMPPEQWAQLELTPTADQYSLAVTAYQLVAGRLPYEAESVPSLWYKIENEEPTPLNVIRPDVPPGVMLVIGRAMMKNPAERFPNCTQFAQAFSSAVGSIHTDVTHYFTFKLANMRQPEASPNRMSGMRADPSLMPSSATIIGTHLPPKRPPRNLMTVAIGALAVIAILALLLSYRGGLSESDLRLTSVNATLSGMAGNTPTATVTPSPSLSPTATASLSPREAALATLNANATGTATQWTLTPSQTYTATEDYDATVRAEITAVHYEGLTATATLWTPTSTPTSSSTPDFTFAFRPISHNAGWTPKSSDFDGVTMSLVPAGCIDMGSDDGSPNELPVHGVCFDAPFWIDRTEVNQAQFAAFSGVASRPPQRTGGDYPVENITWLEARDYCEHRGARLPTEAEWEYAARGPESWEYPWGDDFNPDNLVWAGNSRGRPSIVALRPQGASWVGAIDMSGNVWEWVNSLYEPYVFGTSDGSDPEVLNQTNVTRVLRGGSWQDSDARQLRAAVRNNRDPLDRSETIGFRCAREFG